MTTHIFVTKLTDLRASTGQKDVLGSIRYESNKVYKYCYLKAVPTAEVDAVAGDALCYTDYSAHEVGVDITDMDASLSAGVSLATIDMSADVGKYLWVHIKGPTTLAQTVAGSAQAGDQFDLGSASAADKTFTLHVDSGAAGGVSKPAGLLINATTKEAVLDCVY